MTHSVPLSADVLAREVGVRVDSGQLDAVGLGNLQDLVVDAQGGHALLVSLRQSGLELIMSCNQTLYGRKVTRKIWSDNFNLNCHFKLLYPVIFMCSKLSDMITQSSKTDRGPDYKQIRFI